MEITRTQARRIIETVDAGLVKGVGAPVPGSMCVEAAVCYALGLPHGDDPKCVSRAVRGLKIILNDSAWSSDKARAQGMRKLAILQLGTNENFDDRAFAQRVALMTINKIVPLALRDVGLKTEIKACEQATDLPSASAAAYAASAAAAYVASAAANAASYAARAASYAANAASYAASYAASAARAAANAASYAANAASYAAADSAYAASYAARAARAAAASGDTVLNLFSEEVSQILIAMEVPSVAFLDLL